MRWSGENFLTISAWWAECRGSSSRRSPQPTIFLQEPRTEETGKIQARVNLDVFHRPDPEPRGKFRAVMGAPSQCSSHSSSDDEEGGADVLVRLGGALARANRNDEAATALHKALSIMGRGSDEAFKARENFMVVVNRSAIPSHISTIRVEIVCFWRSNHSSHSKHSADFPHCPSAGFPIALSERLPAHRMANAVRTRRPIKLVTIFSPAPSHHPHRSLFQPLHGFRALHDSAMLAELQAAVEAGRHNALCSL